MVQMQPPRFQDVVYPTGAQAIGWIALAIPMLPIPAFAVHQLVSKSRSATARLVSVAPTTIAANDMAHNGLGVSKGLEVEPTAPPAASEGSSGFCASCSIRKQPMWLQRLAQVALRILCIQVVPSWHKQQE